MTKTFLAAAFLITGLSAQGAESLHHNADAITKAKQGVEREIRVAETDPGRPTYHLLPPARWMNDPNGAFYADGWYHVFYQFNPYGNGWGNMHWGHARSRDNVTWERLPVGIWPDKAKGEDHCYSGSAIQDSDGNWQLWYTSVSSVRPKDKDKGKLAWVFNGHVMLKPMDKEFIKWGKTTADPVNTPTLPNNIDGYAWNKYIRDPGFFKVDGRTFMVLGITGKVAPIYEASNKDLSTWKYRGTMSDTAWDCPQMIPMGKKWIYVMSRGAPPRYQVGTFDPETATFTRETQGTLDQGRNYHTISFSVDNKGRAITYSWITGTKAKGWNNCFALPRVITLGKDGHPVQNPVPELATLRGKHKRATVANNRELITKGDTVEIGATFENAGAGTCGLHVRGMDIRYANGTLDVFGTHVKIAPEGKKKAITLQVFLDKSIAEIFINGGKKTVTRTIYPPANALGIEAYAEGEASGTVDVWQMKSMWQDKAQASTATPKKKFLTVKQVVGKPVGKKQSRQIAITKRYLNFPVGHGPQTLAGISKGDTVLREFDINMNADKPAWWAFMDVSAHKGQTITLWAYGVSEKVFAAIAESDEPLGTENLYNEPQRPQLHFTSKRGWNNDVNGMVYYDGEYHLFYQHNPFMTRWGNMTWGHAVSRDLFRWEELGDHILPDKFGVVFSGSAVVDWKNTSGFQKGPYPPLVTIYTSAGNIWYPNMRSQYSKGTYFTQGIAYSNDKGRSWTTYKDNPVVDHIFDENRDPKVIWYAYDKDDKPLNTAAEKLGGHWVMVLFLGNNRMAFLTSTDLKAWQNQGELKSFHECPELFRLPVLTEDGTPTGKSKWLHYGVRSKYMIGDFDGRMFKQDPGTGILSFRKGTAWHASQIFNDVPTEDGRIIVMAWGTRRFEGAAWNHFVSLPVVLTLRETPNGLRLFGNVAKEIEHLRTGKRHQFSVETDNEQVLDGINAELLDIEVKVEFGTATKVGLNIRGIPVTVEKDAVSMHKHRVPLITKDGKATLRVILDRSVVDIFANDGQIFMPMGAAQRRDLPIKAFSEGGKAQMTITVHELQSAWNN